MAQLTPLHPRHQALGACLVNFGGWDMPLHYGSQVDEHHSVRRHCGVFDVSHMRVVDLAGPDVTSYLRRLLANDVGRLDRSGRALYSCMLNPAGGVIDDLIVYRTEQGYRLVVNAGTADSDLQWMREQVGDAAVAIVDRPELAILAVQGPHSASIAATVLGDAAEPLLRLRAFEACTVPGRPGWYCGRTGYTGEDGFEWMLPAEQAGTIFDAILAAGAAPCGLGARDTLRLEAGMNLYGHEMDASTSPWQAGLAWTVALAGERDFIGRAALLAEKSAGVTHKRVGLVLQDRGVLRAGMSVQTPAGPGCVTSGTFSPTLGQSIALARVPVAADANVLVDVRGRLLGARIVRPPFVQHGKILV